MASITLTRTDGGALADADSVVLSDAGGTYGIKNNDTGAIVVADGTAVTHVSTGVYEYDVSDFSEGSYTAVWEVTEDSVVSRVVHVFNVDGAASAPSGTTLADIERELARRVGPYFEEEASAGTTTTVTIDAFQSSLSYLQGVEDLYVLRRGKKSDGTAIAAFPSGDRVRLVDSVDTATGQVTVDRAWSTSPVSGEQLEFHHLHPDRELRRSVVEGLKRCYFEDRVSISFDTAASERNLTDSASWITERRQVRRLQLSFQNSTMLPYRIPWHALHEQDGSVYLAAARDPYPYPLLVLALRPAHTRVNGGTSVVGPDDDDDTVNVNLNYAASAAHVEAWRRFPARLAAAAQTGLQMSRQDAAREFTKLSRARNPRRPQELLLDEPLGYYGPELP